MKSANIVFLFIALLLTSIVFAQTPADMSRVKAAQISDAQLQQYVKQAKARGLTVDEVESELLRRGMASSEVDELKIRIQELGLDAEDGDSEEMESDSTSNRGNSTGSKKGRKVSGAAGKSAETKKDIEFDEGAAKKLRLFGSELFSNSDLNFEPDLRMATPKDYVIGPDDELLLNIYGLNVFQQNLKVTPEGNINVRYAGFINVSGMTMEDATSLIKNRLTKYYSGLHSGATKISLSLGDIRSIRVIIVGAVKRPGTYTLPSVASLFNALYMTGGPTENGSLRNIEVIRNNKVIQKADLYRFLVNGILSSNIRLNDNDVIRVPYAKTLVKLDGKVNRKAIFEIKPGEHLSDLIDFAGGFKSDAFISRIKGTRYAENQRRIVDISGDSIGTFVLRNGDSLFVDSLLDRYQNRVTIVGAVFKPGAYSVDEGMTLKTLIEKAHGIKEDAFTGRAILVRTRQDLTKEYATFPIKPILMGETQGIFIQKEDSIYISSIFDLVDTTTVTINGAVRKPGKFRFEDSLSLKALILKAEGFAENATGLGIEISRRIRDVNVNKPGSKIVEIIQVNDDKNLSSTGMDLVLQPFDIITVKEDPFYKRQISVKISGEVLMPSIYTLQSREERLSSLLKRSGGLLYTADIRGAKLYRKRKQDLVDSVDIKRLLLSLENDTTTRSDSSRYAKNREVAINLAYILSHPGAPDDLTLEDGDELEIPRINNTVSVNGEVYKTLDIMYERNKHLKDYIADAGGVTVNGKQSRTFVIYANGSAAKIKRVLGIFPKYPKIYPGSSVFVPQKPKKTGFDVGRAGIFISAITTLVTAAALLLR